MSRSRILHLPALLSLLALAVASSAPAAADDFPEITAAERTLTEVPGQPNAPAVVLFRNGELHMRGTPGQQLSSTLRVRVREKILTQEGKSFGEVEIHHSRRWRLLRLHGRTVLPDGRVVPLPDDAVFRRTTSRAAKRYVTSIAFPAVEVGAILDYEYELVFDSIYYLEPWYFQDSVPTLHSEIDYEVPDWISFAFWSRDPMRAGIHRDPEEWQKTMRLRRFRVWAENLRAVPDEPDGLPFADLASRFLLVPTRITADDYVLTLMQDWPSTCALYAPDYDKARRDDGDTKRKAKSLAASGTPADKARAIYRFVRDEIELQDAPGIALSADTTVHRILNGRQDAGYAEKALLLTHLLDAVGIDARLVWAADREDGLIDLQLPNPAWFDRMIVAATVDGRRVYLDPSDRSLGFGQLPPGLEGMPALLFDRKTPETITLPVAAFDQNTRQAKVDLALDAGGRLAGTGTLELRGLSAWERLGWQDDAEKTAKAWKDWLTNAFQEFDVKDVKVAEAVDESTVTVTWGMAQREDQVLGDEASLVPSRPLGPLHQPFQLPAASRLSPVLLDYPSRDDLELSLRWPAGWRLDSMPASLLRDGQAGAARVDVALDDASRTLTYHRRVDLKEKSLASQQLYETVRGLYAQVEKNDAQGVTLVRK